MDNSTASLYFNLTMFRTLDTYKYPVFVFFLLLYVFITFANLILITVISQEKSLHEPMYIFIACLSFNALYGSAGFFPRFLMDLLSDTHLISRPACFTQIYVIYSYASFELTLLGIMAYDRYVAVCHPLHYHRKMQLKIVIVLALFAWLCPPCLIIPVIYLATTLPLCGNKLHKVYCANWNIVKLSCISTAKNNISGMFVTIATVFCPLFFVLFTYFRIIIICWKKSSEFKGKVLQKCLPHIISFATYSITAFCDITLSRYNPDEISPYLVIFLSLEFVVIPPILNPLVYGLKLPEIRRHVVRMLSKQTSHDY
ncbi:olfactory receptor 10A7-like [Periophthalmus magnuspinnatus]|uniref:Olfactory receptor n=1 Tax=Periophthalmus magnuspinnatus TaxID=409849 RepID=A0A3B3ZNF0_9GOBI|nr:olfactory receptor 10A7-like [Periophthalmus magnuspinnatus]